MTLIVAKKDGLSIKGVGHQVDIPHGKELPEKILAEQFPFETARFRDALIRSGHVVEHAHKENAPANGGKGTNAKADSAAKAKLTVNPEVFGQPSGDVTPLNGGKGTNE